MKKAISMLAALSLIVGMMTVPASAGTLSETISLPVSGSFTIDNYVSKSTETMVVDGSEESVLWYYVDEETNIQFDISDSNAYADFFICTEEDGEYWTEDLGEYFDDWTTVNVYDKLYSMCDRGGLGVYQPTSDYTAEYVMVYLVFDEDAMIDNAANNAATEVEDNGDEEDSDTSDEDDSYEEEENYDDSEEDSPEDSDDSHNEIEDVAPVFSDVAVGSYCYDSVIWAVENGITLGRTETTFVPNENCSQANIITFLWRAYGEEEPAIANPFTDVTNEGVYYYKAALWAYEKGLVSGTTFGAAEPCTRAQTVTYMWKLDGSPDQIPYGFDDVDEGAAYSSAVSWAVEKGVTNGVTPSTFNPDGICTRGHVVTFLYRYLVG